MCTSNYIVSSGARWECVAAVELKRSNIKTNKLLLVATAQHTCADTPLSKSRAAAIQHRIVLYISNMTSNYLLYTFVKCAMAHSHKCARTELFFPYSIELLYRHFYICFQCKQMRRIRYEEAQQQ